MRVTYLPIENKRFFHFMKLLREVGLNLFLNLKYVISLFIFNLQGVYFKCGKKKTILHDLQ